MSNKTSTIVGNAPRHFAQTYSEARRKFLAAARDRKLHYRAHPHPLNGHDGEPLAMDVVRQGSPEAKNLLLISSACHGVEGFCGSGVQVSLLNDERWHRTVATSGCAVLYIHALNPWGFSMWRRTTHENVDLNRNWHDFDRPLPANAGYDELASAVVPETWPEPPEAQARLAAYTARHGERGLQTAVSGGQYNHPNGIFYGGRSPTWSQLTLRNVLREHGQRCQRLAWIDLHTGLGPSGHGERIFACRDDAAALKRAHAWWGSDVTSIYDGSSTSAVLQGLMWMGAYQECPQAEYTGIALEYGTQPMAQVMEALRADQWLQNHPEAPESQYVSIRRQVRDAFYVDTDAWKRQIVEQGLDAAQDALQGMKG